MLSRRHALLAAATTFAALALPAVASAEDFCVGGLAGCTGTPVAAGGLKAALTAAQSNGTDDRFFLAPGAYSADAFSHKSAERVQIVGAGADKTTVRGSLADEPVLRLAGNPGSSVSSLSVQPTGDVIAGLYLEGAHARQVTVNAAGGSLYYGAVLTSAGTFDGGRVHLGTGDGYAVGVINGAVTGSILDAPSGTGVGAFEGAATVRRSTLSGAAGAVADGSRLTITDSVFNGAQVAVIAGPGWGLVGTTATVDVERATISGGKVGVFAVADNPGESATVHVRDTVISGSATPVARMAATGATAAVTTDRSVYPAPTQVIDVGPGKLVEADHRSVDPRFVDEAGGDFHLVSDSPLIDAGTPQAFPAGAADRDGAPRASDGNGDCAAVSDIGAFEYQGTRVGSCAVAPPTPPTTAGVGVTAPPAPVAPRISRLHVTPSRVQIGSALPKLVRTTVKRPLATIGFRLSKRATVTLRFVKLTRSGKPQTLKPTLRIKARKGRNRIRFAARLTRTVALAPGNYQLTAVATDPAGARSKRTRTRFTAIKATGR